MGFDSLIYFFMLNIHNFTESLLTNDIDWLFLALSLTIFILL